MGLPVYRNSEFKSEPLKVHLTFTFSLLPGFFDSHFIPLLIMGKYGLMFKTQNIAQNLVKQGLTSTHKNFFTVL